jgi:hypothetical protein
MCMTQIKAAAAVVLTVGVIGIGTDLHGRPVASDERSGQEQERRRLDVPREREDGEGAPRAHVIGRVLEVSADGTRLTVRSPARGRANAPPVEIVLTDKTKQTFFKVGPGGARPAVGHTVHIWLEEGKATTAARVDFTGGTEERKPRMLSGRVVAVSADDRVITVEGRLGDRERDGGNQRMKVRITPKTQVIFNGVPKGGAAPTVDYQARVWLDDEADDIAVRVEFSIADARRDGDGGR